MVLKVLMYEPYRQAHLCEDENGERYSVDLNIDGDLTKIPYSMLVGKTVEVDWLQPYVSIGVGCRCI